MHQSIATIDSPEFINLQPMDKNPLMSSCEIKVLYLGENRNHSYITKEVASDMAKSLRGAPIVGYYKEEKEDFADHGHRMIFDDEGIKFECLTVPYGFVSPDAKVWFQKFEDTDDFGNKITREYMMTIGYLWTGQFEECKSVLENGKPQSMELDDATLDGHWSTNNKTGMDFFIINDAIFSKLCILGEDIEPCFEGASVTKPEVSSSFTLVNDEFSKTLYTMMQDLKSALEGGQSMELEKDSKEMLDETSTNFAKKDDKEQDEKDKEQKDDTSSDDKSDKEEEDKDNKKKYAKKDDEEKDSTSDNKNEKDEEDKKKKDVTDNACGGDKKKKYNLEIEQELSELQVKYTKLEEDYQALVQFKEEIDNEKKDNLINSFYMLSDEDKKDVIENKSKYSLEDIEAKLSVICVRKKVNFDLEDKEEDTKDVTATFSLQDSGSSIPAWVSAVKNTAQKNRE